MRLRKLGNSRCNVDKGHRRRDGVEGLSIEGDTAMMLKWREWFLMDEHCVRVTALSRLTPRRQYD